MVVVVVMRTPFFGFPIFLYLPFALDKSHVLSNVYFGIMTAFKERLELEHVKLDHSVLLHVFDVVSLQLSQENLFRELGIVGHIHSAMKMCFLT
jgi:hypothetical protein